MTNPMATQHAETAFHHLRQAAAYERQKRHKAADLARRHAAMNLRAAAFYINRYGV